MRFRVDATNKIGAIKERKSEVTVLALVGWRIALKGVFKIPDLLRIVAIPNDVIKWTQAFD
jgi:hypothetical protein